jgi:cobalt-zinc-cadmium efflux system membrane fusion protein
MTSVPSPLEKNRWIVLIGLLLLAAGLVTAVALALTVFRAHLPFGFAPATSSASPNPSAPSATSTVELVEGTNDTIIVPEPVRKALGIGTLGVAASPVRTRPLTMPGSTQLDPTRIGRVRTRFNAEVMELGQVHEVSHDGEPSITRDLRPGDTVRKGDVLAVVWSVDVGSKKSDLVDALVQLRLDEKRLEQREAGFKNGSVPEDTLNQTRRDVLTDRNAVDRAERILRTWNVPEEEIKAVSEEAEQASLRGGKRDKEKERLWARSALLAPRDGTIIERNVGPGEYVADNTINLFVIADVSRLQVIANPPEDTLPILLALPRERRRWTIETVGATAAEGPIDEIGYLLDPAQHTAVVKGYIPNTERQLRAGQFVSASVELPPPPDVVEVPLTALVDDGRLSFIFVQPDPNKPAVTLRRVLVTHRFDQTAFVRSKLTAKDRERTPDEIKRGLPAPEPLRPGENYLTTGALELRAALEDRLSRARSEH